LKNDLATPSFGELKDLLQRALARETLPKPSGLEEVWDLALSARGLLDAARLLAGQYHLVITNVPYKKLNELCDELRAFCDSNYSNVKGDLANVFLERCLELSLAGNLGVVQIVMPQNWLFLTTYKKQRKNLLKHVSWNLLARLGPGAFETISGEVVNVILLTQTHAHAPTNFMLQGLDASKPRTAREKADALRNGELVALSQEKQAANPDGIVTLGDVVGATLFSAYAGCYQGTSTGDNPRFVKFFWESSETERGHYFQGPSERTSLFGGRRSVVDWEALQSFEGAALRGESAWGQEGVAIGQMTSLPATLYSGTLFSNSTPVIIPKSLEHLPAIWCFCTSADFLEGLRAINQKLSVDNGYVGKIDFDLDLWEKVARERYPNGLPKPFSNDPSQWVFHGHPQHSADPMQVAVARLVGYAWPAEIDDKMDLSDESYDWIARSKALAPHADKDGIVCIPPVGSEPSASDRLLNLLAGAYGADWSNDVLAQLLAAADHAGKSLETWLRDKFFTQHCALFGNRPFVWHIWDGLRDGFAALVNYHKLDYKTLETLIYTYLGDWISRQKRDGDTGVDGAQERLAAAEGLKKRLELILAGEAPYDIFVRWKPLDQQPIGWHPDLNDGVRLNNRPFLSVPDVGKRGAGVLRDKPNIKWDKDRGSDVPSAPWYDLGPQYGGKVGDRINGHHLTLAEKRAAQVKCK
jgi:hypothetical protein